MTDIGKIQNILRRPAAATDYAGKNHRSDAEMKHLEAVSKALEDVPRLASESSDTLANKFVEIADQAAKALEELGDASLHDGQRRRDEYYRLATATRHKGRYQAKETLGYLSGIEKIKNVSIEAAIPAITLAATEEVAPTEKTE